MATTTPLLKSKIDALPDALGLRSRYTGARFAEGDPHDLMRDPARLRAALAGAVEACIAQDGAEAVIIGGGPLGEAARALQPMFAVPVIAPIPSAVAADYSPHHRARRRLIFRPAGASSRPASRPLTAAAKVKKQDHRTCRPSPRLAGHGDSCMSFKKLLIANRGEIAIRIARAAADAGIATRCDPPRG